MTDILSTKEIINRATFGIPKGMEKCNFYFYCFGIDVLIKTENIISEERKNKKTRLK